MNSDKKPALKALYIVLTLFVISGLGFYGYKQYSKFKSDFMALEEARNASEEKILEISSKYQILEEEKNTLSNELATEKDKNEKLEKELKKVSRKADDLEELFETDKELLQKYSKVYFLNEHYIPSKVVDIDSEYLLNPTKKIQIHGEVLSHLEEMIYDAEEDGIDLKIVSGYRSFDEQAGLKSAYTVAYGSGANTFSADQGYSEHQLGTTVDITTPEVGGLTNSFENTEAYTWLTENAYKYGFILSYPKGNKYYVFEPWHWRFVSEDLARRLHKKEQSFYDWDQRDIDQYLLDFFD